MNNWVCFSVVAHLKFLIRARSQEGRAVVSSETWRTWVVPACHWGWWSDESCISSPLHWLMKPISAAMQTRSVTHLFFIFSPDSLGPCASLNSFISLCSLQMCCRQSQAKGIKQQRCFQMEPFIAALTSLPKPLTIVPAKLHRLPRMPLPRSCIPTASTNWQLIFLIHSGKAQFSKKQTWWALVIHYLIRTKVTMVSQFLVSCINFTSFMHDIEICIYCLMFSLVIHSKVYYLN